MTVVVHSAAVQDRDGAKLVLEAIRVKKIWADGGYAGALVEWVRSTVRARGLALDIAKRPEDMTGSVALPRRWVVERTFGWLGRNRRLSQDYEEKTASSEAMVKVAMIHLMARRLVKKLAF
jgi:putative transposase